jgi:hypothetical protein
MNVYAVALTDVVPIISKTLRLVESNIVKLLVVGDTEIQRNVALAESATGKKIALNSFEPRRPDASGNTVSRSNLSPPKLDDSKTAAKSVTTNPAADGRSFTSITITKPENDEVYFASDATAPSDSSLMTRI